MLLHRKPTRLPNYDYNQNGCYFITICTKDRQCLLSSVAGGRPHVGADDLGSPHIELKRCGKIVEENILRMNQIYAEMNVDHFVIMPNHVHLLLDSFGDFQGAPGSSQGAPGSSPPTNHISKYVAAFKKFTEKEASICLWQRGFYDHIIRDEDDYLDHIQYIAENPAMWTMGKDKYYA